MAQANAVPCQSQEAIEPKRDKQYKNWEDKQWAIRVDLNDEPRSNKYAK